jgi:heme oxygenase
VTAAERQARRDPSVLATSLDATSGAAALQVLRAASWPRHQRLEQRLNVKQRFTTRDAYAAHLARMWGFCTGLEQSLDPHAMQPVLEDYGDRSKLPLLERDLKVLGFEAAAIAGLPVCPAFSPDADLASAFGSLYVLEGATLGGRTLLPLVHGHLGYSAGRGAAFLASYGEAVGMMWQRFGAALESWCCNAERKARAADAATQTFARLEHWLCGDAP